MLISSLIGDRKVIIVSGAHKGVGKTALAEIILRNLRNFAAIKITMTDDMVAVTDDEKEIMSPATDTFRMKKSGAVKVVWVRSTEDCLLQSMRAAFDKMTPCNGILIEGNSILRHVQPTVSFFVIKDSIIAMKPSRVHAIKKADVCVINRLHGIRREEELRQRLNTFNSTMMLLFLNLLNPSIAEEDDYNRLLNILKTRIPA